MRKSMRIASVLAFLAISAACQRTPPEEIARSATTTTATTSRSSLPAAEAPPAAVHDESHERDPIAPPLLSPPDASPGRCVKLTPVAPPPPVAPGPAPACPRDPEPARAPLPRVKVVFPGADGKPVDAELVRTPQDAARGLMYRKSMSEERGMLFDLQVKDDHRFWMHNTCIPLDLLFIDEDGLLVGIVENAPTLDDAPRSVGCESRWVLEVNAGWCRRHGVRAGQKVVLPDYRP